MSAAEKAPKGIVDWCIEHVRPSVSFNRPDSPDTPESYSLGDWVDYAEDNATFKIGLQFPF